MDSWDSLSLTLDDEDITENLINDFLFLFMSCVFKKKEEQSNDMLNYKKEETYPSSVIDKFI